MAEEKKAKIRLVIYQGPKNKMIDVKPNLKVPFNVYIEGLTDALKKGPIPLIANASPLGPLSSFYKVILGIKINTEHVKAGEIVEIEVQEDYYDHFGNLLDVPMETVFIKIETSMKLGWLLQQGDFEMVHVGDGEIENELERKCNGVNFSGKKEIN